MASFEIVIGNPRAQMVNVMKPDVAREPLQNPWKLVERTALQRRLCVIPFFTPLPINPFKLVLHIE